MGVRIPVGMSGISITSIKHELACVSTGVWLKGRIIEGIPHVKVFRIDAIKESRVQTIGPCTG